MTEQKTKEGFVYDRFHEPITVGDEVKLLCTGPWGGAEGEVVGFGRTRVKVRIHDRYVGSVDDAVVVHIEPTCLRHLNIPPELMARYERERIERLKELYPSGQVLSRLGIIGRERALVDGLAKLLHGAAKKQHDYTGVRETQRGSRFDVRFVGPDGEPTKYVARVTIEMLLHGKEV